MNDLTVIMQQCDTLLVDSRLITRTLGVQHRGWYQNILLKYQDVIEQTYGELRLETTTIRNRFGPINELKFALLTEDQAIFLMTLTRNIPQVIACKAAFIKSVSEVKRMLGY
jgi:hypothetical protein